MSKKNTTIEVDLPKARNRQLHEVLSGRKGGRMADRKKDYSRARLKGRDRDMAD